MTSRIFCLPKNSLRSISFFINQFMDNSSVSNNLFERLWSNESLQVFPDSHFSYIIFHIVEKKETNFSTSDFLTKFIFSPREGSDNWISWIFYFKSISQFNNPFFSLWVLNPISNVLTEISALLVINSIRRSVDCLKTSPIPSAEGSMNALMSVL